MRCTTGSRSANYTPLTWGNPVSEGGLERLSPGGHRGAPAGTGTHCELA